MNKDDIRRTFKFDTGLDSNVENTGSSVSDIISEIEETLHDIEGEVKDHVDDIITWQNPEAEKEFDKVLANTFSGLKSRLTDDLSEGTGIMSVRTEYFEWLEEIAEKWLSTQSSSPVR